MNSNNSSDMNPKQRELINKLENIRKKRNVENRTKMKQKRNTPTQQKRNIKPVKNTTFEETTNFEQLNQKHMESQYNKKKKNSHKNNKKDDKLTQQLINGNNLAQAMILSEVLSKPVALRNQNR